MKIVADENIPFVRELFTPFGEVVLVPGRSMDSSTLERADVLLVRSVTPVNKSLLSKSNVRFVGTCTIGTDHIDKNFLKENGISYSSAPGCNANGVVQYVVTALNSLNALDVNKQVSIVGFGNVGRRLYKMLKTLGFRVNCYDPFKTAEDCEDLVAFESIFDSDIVCLHAPFTQSGSHPTQHMFSTREFKSLKSDAILLNAGRGKVIDNMALVEYLNHNDDLTVVLDVWENEPAINVDLFNHVAIGSPHIAGYSYEGRVTGSTMIFEALSSFLEMSNQKSNEILSSTLKKAFGEKEEIRARTLKEAINLVYPIERDHEDLSVALNNLPDSFDALRKNYFKRREFSHYLCSGVSTSENNLLKALGFEILE